MNVNLNGALIIYLIVVIGLILILIRSGVYTFSAIVISLIIGQIIILFIVPPCDIDPFCANTSATALYYLINVGTPILAIVFIFVKGFRDTRA